MQDDVQAGQAIYTRRNLALYDVLVHGVSNRFVWRCPTRRLLEHYRRCVSANHLDVGVGTGYFLDRCAFPSPSPRVALMDLNPQSLAYAARRIARYRPETYRRNVLEPIAVEAPPFDSLGATYLLHCLPGSIAEKAVAFDHLRTLLHPGGVLFGATLLQGGVARTRAAVRLMAFYNRRGIFCNERDDLDGLRRALEQRFHDVAVEVAGCAALFSGRT